MSHSPASPPPFRVKRVRLFASPTKKAPRTRIIKPLNGDSMKEALKCLRRLGRRRFVTKSVKGITVSSIITGQLKTIYDGYNGQILRYEFESQLSMELRAWRLPPSIWSQVSQTLPSISLSKTPTLLIDFSMLRSQEQLKSWSSIRVITLMRCLVFHKKIYYAVLLNEPISEYLSHSITSRLCG